MRRNQASRTHWQTCVPLATSPLGQDLAQEAIYVLVLGRLERATTLVGCQCLQREGCDCTEGCLCVFATVDVQLYM